MNCTVVYCCRWEPCKLETCTDQQRTHVGAIGCCWLTWRTQCCSMPRSSCRDPHQVAFHCMKAVLCCAVLCCAVLCCAVPCRAFINFSYSYVLLSGNRCCRVWCGTILAKNMTSSLQTWQHAWNLCVCAIRSPCHWFEYRLALSQCAVQCCRVTRGMAAICDSPKSAVSRHSIVIHVFF